MKETTHADHGSVYEIGYLIVSSLPEEKISGEAEAIAKIITDAGSETIASGAPERIKLAYEMRKKSVSGTYEKYTEAYFGWAKFEVGSDKIEAIKKAVEVLPSVLRMLLISTVRENTYLGKRAHVLIADTTKKVSSDEPEAEESTEKQEDTTASIEEMDKSIDDMVKEV